MPNPNSPTGPHSSILSDKDYLRNIRRDIHAHPELAFEEVRTAKLVANELTNAGIEVTTGIGGTGVVGKLCYGTSDRAIGLRADMDALAMEEANDISYKSVEPGKFHGCGHDGHTVMLLGAARHLARNRVFDGTVYFIFQPAEEGAGGAEAMVRDGLFTRFPMQQVFGMHNYPALDIGSFALRSRAFFASYQPFDICILGKGGHAALPQASVDPVPIAAQIVQNLQTVVSRNVDPQQGSVVSITQIQAGNSYNVLPDAVSIGGSIRYFDNEVGTLIKDRMTQIVEGISRSNSAKGTVIFQKIYYPPLINAESESDLARKAAESLVGSDHVDAEYPKMMASDDFAHMLNERPGCYILIGNGGDDVHSTCMVHNSEYDFNDEVTPLGASYWVRLVETALPM